jgi:hypothetical protein
VVRGGLGAGDRVLRHRRRRPGARRRPVGATSRSARPPVPGPSGS